jgi:hypothetical protein
VVSAALTNTRPVIDVLANLDLESIAHNPEGFEGAPPGAESSDRRNWAGSCVCANNVQRKCLVPTRTVGSNPAPATRKTTVFVENGGFSNFLSIFLRRHPVGKTNLAPPIRRRIVDSVEYTDKSMW